MPESVIAALESVIAVRALAVAAQVRATSVVGIEQAQDRSIAAGARAGRLVVAPLHKRATSAAAVLPVWRAHERPAAAGRAPAAAALAVVAAGAGVAGDERE